MRKHLKNVYASFTLASLSACAGGYVHMFSTIIGAGLLTSLGALAVLTCLFMTPYDGKNQKQRLAMLSGFAFLTGINLGPLLQMAVMVNQTLVRFSSVESIHMRTITQTYLKWYIIDTQGLKPVFLDMFLKFAKNFNSDVMSLIYTITLNF